MNPVNRHFGIFIRGAIYVAVAMALLASSVAWARPTQEDVLRSISQKVGDSGNTGPALILGFALSIVVVGVLVMVNRHRNRKVDPKSPNHPGKLLKEASAAINLKPAEINRLKSLADRQGVSSPLVLLLCPSMLARAMRKDDASAEDQRDGQR